MIIVKLMGGLGNQMFQYACARCLAEKNNDSVKLDLSWYRPGGIAPGDTVRQYELDKFAISAQIASREELERFKRRSPRISALIRKLVDMVLQVKHLSFDAKVLEQKGDVYLEGYFQNERYFKDIEFIIRNEFRLKDIMGRAAHAALQDIEQSNAISLHVRRGDYVANINTNVFHGVCSPEYYRGAIDTMCKRVDSPKFFIFSDDIPWVKEHIEISYPVTYVSNGEIADHEELALMSKCKHNIIANSSFSWWGAWLNGNPNKIVIAPAQWLADPAAARSDIVPESWMRM